MTPPSGCTPRPVVKASDPTTPTPPTEPASREVGTLTVVGDPASSGVRVRWEVDPAGAVPPDWTASGIAWGDPDDTSDDQSLTVEQTRARYEPDVAGDGSIEPQGIPQHTYSSSGVFRFQWRGPRGSITTVDIDTR